MHKNILLKKGLVAGIIVLLVGVTIASGITLKVNTSETIQKEVSNNELVKMPVSICKADKVKDYEVSLTQQQVKELDNLIDNFELELNKVETLEETDELFRDIISSFDEFGILPDDMSIEEAQQLVTGDKYRIRPETCIRKRITQFINAVVYNEYCYLYVKASNSSWWGVFYFGETCPDPFGSWVDYYPAKGWVWTNGKMGIRELEGSFKGYVRDIGTPPNQYYPCTGHVGTIGFWGFRIRDIPLFLGYTLVARFVNWYPE